MRGKPVDEQLVVTTILFVVLPSTLLAFGVWGAPLLPRIFDLSGLSIGPSTVVFVLGVTLAVVVGNYPTDRTTKGEFPAMSDFEGNSGARSWVALLTVVCMIGGAAGLVGAYTGKFTQYTVLFWVSVLYGAGVTRFYHLDVIQQSTDGSTVK